MHHAPPPPEALGDVSDRCRVALLSVWTPHAPWSLEGGDPFGPGRAERPLKEEDTLGKFGVEESLNIDLN